MANREMLCGGISPISAEKQKEAEELLEQSLLKLAAGEGPSYKISKVISASHQVVSGSLYRYKVELTDSNDETKQCEVKIWSQPWLPDGLQISLLFEGQEKIEQRFAP